MKQFPWRFYVNGPKLEFFDTSSHVVRSWIDGWRAPPWLACICWSGKVHSSASWTGLLQKRREGQNLPCVLCPWDPSGAVDASVDLRRLVRSGGADIAK